MTATAIKLTPKSKVLATSDIVIGKDILELLANAMYVDPLTIYREYIQNAADSIDEARNSGLSVDDPRVTIDLDQATRTVRIRDNGEGISNLDFVQRITSVGASHKRGTELRGFRGVGRLSGLGYCQELVFRGKSEGDPRIIEVTWNSRALKERIRDAGYQGSLADIIHEIVTYTDTPAADKSERFFEVELRKVGRLKNDLLMNEQLIRAYLSQVAPVPISPDFSGATQINEILAEHGIRHPINIDLNDGAGPVYHRIRDQIDFHPKLSDTIRSIEPITIRGDDGEVAAFGWVADHAYMGSIPKRLGMGGIRLRAGNIQVGDESLLAPLYPEQRFAGWAIGDIHVVSKKIVPNGRRDDFEHNVHYMWLQSELATRTSAIAHQIRTRSQQRQRLRTVQLYVQSIHNWIQIAAAPDTPSLLRAALLDLTTDQLRLADKEAARLPEESDDRRLVANHIQPFREQLEAFGQQLSPDQLDRGNHSKATGQALVKALKVVLSNARSAKVGVKTAMDIVKAVS